MENGEEEFDKLTDLESIIYDEDYPIKIKESLYDEDSYPDSMYELSTNKIKDFIKNLIQQIRQDTLRQVLPVIKIHKEGEGDYCDTGEDMNGACRSNCVELAVERLINKAKEIGGIELNNN